MSHLHPNRKLVQKLEKDTGGYVFNERKSIDLLNDIKGKNLEKNVLEKHENIKAQTDEEKEVNQKINDVNEQQKREYKENQDQNAEPIIGASVNVRGEKNQVTEKLGISSDTGIKETEDSLIDTTDSAWGIEEMNFGAAPMS